MKQYKAKVLDIQIPKQFKDDELIDIIFRDKIQFKIMSLEGVETIELKQNEFNTKIHINDEVLITKQKVSNVDFIDIEKVDNNETR